MENVANFRRAANRWPSPSATDPAERKLGEWLNNQRRYVKRGGNPAFTPERAAYIDQFLIGWRLEYKVLRATKTFQGYARDLAHFRSANNRWPSASSPRVHERSLAEWRHNQRWYAKTGTNPAFTAERAAHLDQVVPGWTETRDGRRGDHFYTRAQDLAHFWSVHRRWPSTGATLTHERSLGHWLNNQRRYAKRPTNPAFTSERAEYLDSFAPGWRDRP